MTGAADFDAFYKSLYGDRWEGLRAALLNPNDALGVHFSAEGEIEFIEDPPEGIYRMDRASIEAAKMLHLPKAGIILDACAAPGGKTLVLAGRSGPQVRIEANELSSERRRRLRDVLDGQLPHVTRARVSVTGYDAARLCRTTKIGMTQSSSMPLVPLSGTYSILNVRFRCGRPRAHASLPCDSGRCCRAVFSC